jgi:hypothetical protein
VLDHDADLAAASERHDDERSQRRFDPGRKPEVEDIIQRNVERYAGDAHDVGAPLWRGVESLWISL